MSHWRSNKLIMLMLAGWDHNPQKLNSGKAYKLIRRLIFPSATSLRAHANKLGPQPAKAQSQAKRTNLYAEECVQLEKQPAHLGHAYRLEPQPAKAKTQAKRTNSYADECVHWQSNKLMNVSNWRSNKLIVLMCAG